MKISRLLGLALLAGAALTTEIVLTRVYSVVMWYHFAFMAISVSLFGLGLGGIFWHIVGRRFEGREEGALAYAGAAMGLANGVAVALLLTLKLGSFSFDQHSLLSLAAVYLSSALPFMAAGVFVSLMLRLGGKRAGLVYLFDLVGAGLGCLLTIPLLKLVGGPAAVLAAGALAALAGLLASWPLKPLRVAACLAVATALLTVVGVHLTTGATLLEPRYVKGNEEPAKLAVAWNSFSRVIAFPRPQFGDIMLEIDGIAHTPITPFDGDAAKTQDAMANLQRLPFVARPHARALIFGAGGGEHILTALDAGAEQIVGLEYNPIVVDMVRRRFAHVSGGLFDLPNVRIVVDEGRSWIRRTPEKFDVIQFTLIDTWAATAAGAFALTENNVFTLEAMNEYLDRLQPGGLISIKRWSDAYEVVLRLTALAKAALMQRGAKRPEQHFFMAHEGEFINLMFKNEPFTIDEMGDLLEQCAKLNLQVGYSPFAAGDDPRFTELVANADLRGWLAKQQLDLSPPTDDHPFLFYTSRLTDLPAIMKQAYSAKLHNLGPALLLALLGLVAAFIAALIVLPALLTRDPQASPPLRWTAYFALLGLAYLLVEVALMQKFILYLGHPTYALAVVLFTLLVSSGLGAALSEWIPADKVEGRLRALMGALAFVAAALVVVSPRLFHETLAWPLLSRALVCAAMIAPLGALMGMPFPLGVRLVSYDYPRGAPWMYAVNSAASVFGSVAAMLIALHWGFSAAVAAGLALYVVAAFIP